MSQGIELPQGTHEALLVIQRGEEGGVAVLDGDDGPIGECLSGRRRGDRLGSAIMTIVLAPDQFPLLQ